MLHAADALDDGFDILSSPVVERCDPDAMSLDSPLSLDGDFELSAARFSLPSFSQPDLWPELPDEFALYARPRAPQPRSPPKRAWLVMKPFASFEAAEFAVAQLRRLISERT
jgi:hypothetical protein